MRGSNLCLWICYGAGINPYSFLTLQQNREGAEPQEGLGRGCHAFMADPVLPKTTGEPTATAGAFSDAPGLVRSPQSLFISLLTPPSPLSPRPEGAVKPQTGPRWRPRRFSPARGGGGVEGQNQPRRRRRDRPHNRRGSLFAGGGGPRPPHRHHRCPSRRRPPQQLPLPAALLSLLPPPPPPASSPRFGGGRDRGPAPPYCWIGGAGRRGRPGSRRAALVLRCCGEAAPGRARSCGLPAPAAAAGRAGWRAGGRRRRGGGCERPGRAPQDAAVLTQDLWPAVDAALRARSRARWARR